MAGPGEAHPPQAKQITPTGTRQRNFLSTQSIARAPRMNGDKTKKTKT
jgi:hypothetical protein